MSKYPQVLLGAVVLFGPMLLAWHSLAIWWMAFALVAIWAWFGIVTMSLAWSDAARMGWIRWWRREGDLVFRRVAIGLYWSILLGYWISLGWTLHVIIDDVSRLWVKSIVVLALLAIRWALRAPYHRILRPIGGLLALLFVLLIPLAWPHGMAGQVTAPKLLIGWWFIMLLLPDGRDMSARVGARYGQYLIGGCLAAGASYAVVYHGLPSEVLIWDGLVLSITAAGFRGSTPAASTWVGPRAESIVVVGTALAMSVQLVVGILALAVVGSFAWPIWIQMRLLFVRPRLYRPYRWLTSFLLVVLAGWLGFVIWQTVKSGMGPSVLAWGLWITAASLVWANVHQLWPFQRPGHPVSHD